MGWFSALIERRPLRAWAIVAIMGAIAMATVLLVGMQAAQASHPEVSLTGSDFEIDTNANLKRDDASPSIDWASVTETRKADKPTGANDDSFGTGTKEDTPVPSVVNGSIPPNKSDLLNFGVYLETTPSGARFLNLFWHRVQEPSGTTNMDFEFNQSSATSSNGVTPVRTAGDLLIEYDLSQGGTNPCFASALGRTLQKNLAAKLSRHIVSLWEESMQHGDNRLEGDLTPEEQEAVRYVEAWGSRDVCREEAQAYLGALTPLGRERVHAVLWARVEAARERRRVLENLLEDRPT